MSVLGTLIPFFVDDVLDQPKTLVGTGFTFQNAASTIGLVVTGALSDVIGLRRTVLIVSLGNVLSLNLLGFARSPTVLIILQSFFGFCTTYALALTWVTRLVPGPKLARWLAWTVCFAQLCVSVGGLIAGALVGEQLPLACGIMSAAPAVAALSLVFARDVPKAADAGKPNSSTRDGIRKAFQTRYFRCVAFAPFAQGCFIGGVFNTLCPLVLKDRHGFSEAEVARQFQIGGLVALLSHAFFTPWVSSRSWRHLAVQAMAVINVVLLLVYGWLGETYPTVAFVLPIIGFVLTAIMLGCCNLMCALLAQAVAPEALGALTGLTRCLFTLGTAIPPVLIVPLMNAGGLKAPCILVASLFAIKAILLFGCAKLPASRAATYAAATVGEVQEGAGAAAASS